MAAGRLSIWLVIIIVIRGNVKMNNRKAFTIVELLMSITIIALLLGILVPSINMVNTKAKEKAQKAQFLTIDMALETFKQDYGDYPPSEWHEGSTPAFTGRVYCGTQKLTEALLGWDLAGFHPKTSWRRDGYTGPGIPLGGIDAYDPCRMRPATPQGPPTLLERKGPYLEVAKTPVFRLGTSGAISNDGLYGYTLPNLAPFDRDKPNYVICDVFKVKKITTAIAGGSTITSSAGSPILYYRANTNSKIFDCPANVLTAANRIYNYYDNLILLRLGVLPNANRTHSLFLPPGSPPPAQGQYFCDRRYKIADQKIPAFPDGTSWPNRPDTYLLISAGADHEFGTSDDILNF